MSDDDNLNEVFAEQEENPQFSEDAPDHDEAQNFIAAGQTFNLTQAMPTLKNLIVAVGWDQRAFEEQKIDVDVSLFLLDKDGQTRTDEDFIFYNNMEGSEGAVKHLGDSRTGAGDGDDEQIDVDLNGIPYDVLKIAFVLSVYDPDELGHDFSKVKNVFLRLLNKEDDQEIVRFVINDDDLKASGRGLYMAALNREGPEWIFEAQGEAVKAGLAKIATNHGIIVKEVQSTSE